MKHQKGFTLFEILIVVSVLIIIIFITVGTNINVFTTSTLQEEESKVVSSLEKARSRSMANMFEKAHGFCYYDGSYVIFYDGSCDKSASDEYVPANTTISLYPSTVFPASIIFQQLSGGTNATTIHLEDGTKVEEITINNEGTINW